MVDSIDNRSFLTSVACNFDPVNENIIRCHVFIAEKYELLKQALYVTINLLKINTG
jgi:hypothetical protein